MIDRDMFPKFGAILRSSKAGLIPRIQGLTEGELVTMTAVVWLGRSGSKWDSEAATSKIYCEYLDQARAASSDPESRVPICKPEMLQAYLTMGLERLGIDLFDYDKAARCQPKGAA